MKKFMLLILFITFISCNNGSKHIGKWYGKYHYVEINKAGSDGYMIKFTNYHTQNSVSFFCVYDEGCFISDNNKNDNVRICENEYKLIDSQGEIYYKSKQTNR